GWGRTRRQKAWVCGEITPWKTLPALRTQQVAIGDAATLLVDADDARSSLVVTNAGAEALYVAATPEVTTTSGQVVLPGATLTLRAYKGSLFAVSAQPGALATSSEETLIPPSR